MTTNDNRIPVTIITGFLGAGKTTLLNNIIRKHPERRFAIIENEMGEIGIDGGLIVGADNNIFELSNGCICCSLNGDFVETMATLLKQEHEFDHLLIETTGIADPNAVVQSFLAEEFMQKRFRIDCVLCLVDATHVGKLIDSEAEVRKQLSISELVFINKTEGFSADYLSALQDRIEEINPTAQIYRVSQADVSEVNVLDTYSFSGANIEKTTLSFRNIVPLKQGIRHDIQAIGISIPDSFSFNKFGYWIESFLFFNSKNVFRVKGIISLEDNPRKQILQAVSSIYTIEEGADWEDSPRFCKLVFIGRNLVREDLEWALYRLKSGMASL